MSKKGNIFQKFIRKIGVNIPWSVIDDIVASDANILRPVKGHAFEIIFDEIVDKFLKCRIQPGPKDTDIDRIIWSDNKKIELQLKTCSIGSIVDKVKFAVSLHKTHGEEKRPKNLYPITWPCPICPHDGGKFPDFLVILHPAKGILIVPRDKIPESNTYKGHYADPAYFDWNSEWINRWDLLGFPEFRGKSLERRAVPLQTKFPKIAKIVNLTDLKIVKMWLRPENFRTLEMNLKGNLREPAMAEWLRSNGIQNKKPQGIAYPKFDRVTDTGIRIQTKGPSKGLCNIKKNLIGVEVMGSHRKGAGRMYSDKDFDYLGLVIDPKYIPKNIKLNRKQYHYCLIPTSELPLHPKNTLWKTTDKIYPRCKFIIGSNKKGYFLKPYKDYKLKINFRGRGPWYIDKVGILKR